MSTLSPLGIIHTLFSAVALASGLYSMLRTGFIRTRTGLGKFYIVTTAITALTGLFIFHYGGFGKPHILSLLTLVALLVAITCATQSAGKPFSQYVEAFSFTFTLLCHFIPGITETGTRLPAGTPLFASPDAPQLQLIDAMLFVAFLLICTLQFRRLSSPSSLIVAPTKE